MGGWLCSGQRFSLAAADYDRVTHGLGPLVRLHDLVYVVWDPLWSLAMPWMVASRWGDAIGGFFVAGALRCCVTQHVTFLVNSVAHGDRAVGSSYAMDTSACGIGPRVSLVVVLLALGDG